jgi:hypothetical protein
LRLEAINRLPQTSLLQPPTSPQLAGKFRPKVLKTSKVIFSA